MPPAKHLFNSGLVKESPFLYLCRCSEYKSGVNILG